MLRRSPFKRKPPLHQPAVEREPRPMAKLERSVSYAGTTGPAVPKTAPKRNRALLDMARDRPCLLDVQTRLGLDGSVWCKDTDTTVACHSNLSAHGKAGARKADDCYSVWGCGACHFWLDFSHTSAEQKEAVFMGAHLDQVMEWRRVATDPSEPERFRKAAQWALDALNATEVGGMA
jgi:hypothetical protein